MIIVRAPLRISFGGGGTDLPAYYERFGGFVVSAAIDRYCYAAVTEPADGGIHLTSADYRMQLTFEQGKIPPVAEPLALPKAAIRMFAGRGLTGRGADLFLASEVPPGTGLGSSSAMSVALIHALSVYVHSPAGRADAADAASRLEIEHLTKPIGKQDHYASAFGGINAINFQHTGIDVTPLTLSSDVLARLQRRLLLFFTGQSRDSSRILTEQRRDTGRNEIVTDSLHGIKRLAVEMREALEGDDLDALGGLLDRAWHFKKRLSARISSGEIDEWYRVAKEAGALGGKITGAGGGGFLLLYCAEGQQETVRGALRPFNLRDIPFGFDFEGARTMAATEDQSDMAMVQRSGGWNAASAHMARADGEGAHV